MTVLASSAPSVFADFNAGSSSDNPKLHGEMTRCRARTLVECAVLSYKTESEIEQALATDKATRVVKEFKWFEATGRSFDTQAFACVLENDVVVAFRGTKELRDFLTDAMVVKRPLKDFNGHKNDSALVHKGFQRALDAVWSDERSARKTALTKSDEALDTFLRRQDDHHRRLWLTGHSLGAALATIAAARVGLTEGAPFNRRIGALVTIGSPRVLDPRAARRLEDALDRDRIFRIHRSIDPVPAVPYWGFEHVSGRKAFVSNQGALVIGVRKTRRWTERAAAFLLALEDAVGSTLPGRHRGFTKFVSDHASEDYLEAVSKYDTTNTVRVRDSIGPIAVPILKLAGGGTVVWSAADATGVPGMVAGAAVTSAHFLQRGAETLLALMY
jgi:triacylglycerol lipase